ncbi:thioredoxin-disulfide reductase [Fructobacillus evanidus]|uniref:Thioredoxin reductase n=1 Tax=Fructobacillus evanidus TaxID=3064281 RepID=A0ABN9YKN6_9LACO|nr:Thioredoxin reductase (TrxB) [Fructobacillus sp. LMG 32999]CAK1221615.1 Thioredoxin reductase (TrxB) [Fructobacillus sp. LMG 32999]CAK1225127.1 Thioredoxin reductase (TrxB) [Fructobacillus sp. LMG 32999]CAK1229077.1 Thioredoxin reductase (TrxB) [Fructobacillus sp. LMG 32999]CAK1229268.1 Thioredoxin reductase (TrxB) [Fructobacillus sp. LMG 32999]
MTEVKQYDVIIIGAGPAGMTAATYASRADLKTVMLDQGIYGGQMNNTAEVENYPGYNSIMGPDLAEKMYASSTQFGAEYSFGMITGVEILAKNEKLVHTDMGDFQAPALIIATGSEHIHLGVDGEEEYQGKGVSYCAVCDGAFFKGESVAVVGGGDSAVEEGLYLADVVKDVTVYVRDNKLKAQPILQQRAKKQENMHFVWNTEVTAIEGDGEAVSQLKLHNNQTGEDQVVDKSGIFIYVGLKPNTQVFENLGITDDHGWIKTDDKMATAVPGIFAAGDVRAKNLRQITTAVGDGGLAGQEAYQYVAELKSEA